MYTPEGLPLEENCLTKDTHGFLVGVLLGTGGQAVAVGYLNGAVVGGGGGVVVVVVVVVVGLGVVVVVVVLGVLLLLPDPVFW